MGTRCVNPGGVAFDGLLTLPPSARVSPVSGRSVGWLLDTRATRTGDRTFLVWQPFDDSISKTWTYSEFATGARRIASGLSKRGVKQGDRVVLHLDNTPEFLLSWFGALWLGAVPVSTNTRSSDLELMHFVQHSEAVGAISKPDRAEAIASALSADGWVVTATSDGAAVPSTSTAGEDRFESLLAESPYEFTVPLDPGSPACIQYTSGTTSRPKAVVWTHGNVLWGAQVSARHEGLTKDDVHGVFLPLFHTNALCYSMLATMWAGASMVLHPRFSASRFWHTSREHACTWASLSTFCLRALASVAAPPDHSYRMWGAGISTSDLDSVVGVKTIGWWGMTETITHAIVGEIDHDNARMAIGRVAPEYEVSVLREDGTVADVDEPGELVVHGTPGLSLFAGYLNDPDATRGALGEAGSSLATGDLVTVDADGAVRFLGRSRDMLRVGGENVAAAEIEAVLVGVGGVIEAAVVGRPDTMLDEVPVAYVRIAGDRERIAKEAMALCRANLADFKVPKEIRVVDEFPRSTLGKIVKAKMRRELALENQPGMCV